MKKIGLISVILVMAMGIMGVAYASWSDVITINQQVQTGNVEVGVRGVAPDPEEVEGKQVATVGVTHGAFKFQKDFEQSDFPAGTLPPTTPGLYDLYDSATVAISNYYPSLNVREDFFIGYNGSIPVKLSVLLTVDDPDLIYEHMDLTWIKYHNGVLEFQGSGIASEELPKIQAALEGQQLHQSDVVLLWIDKHLRQSAPQGSAPSSFTLDVTAIQWNKY